MVNFRLLAAEICWRVWGTPANFKGYLVLAALLHGTGVSQTAALNRGRHHVLHRPTFLVFNRRLYPLLAYMRSTPVLSVTVPVPVLGWCCRYTLPAPLWVMQ